MADTETIMDETTPRETWVDYERRKKELPPMTSEEYLIAVTDIAEELGI
jgi:hypothetical protein